MMKKMIEKKIQKIQKIEKIQKKKKKIIKRRKYNLISIYLSI
jgi:hypothetical protein